MKKLLYYFLACVLFFVSFAGDDQRVGEPGDRLVLNLMAVDSSGVFSTTLVLVADSTIGADKWLYVTTADGDTFWVKNSRVASSDSCITDSVFVRVTVDTLEVTNDGMIKLLEASSGVNYVGIKAPSLASNVIFTLPQADGNATQVIGTNGSGLLSFYSHDDLYGFESAEHVNHTTDTTVVKTATNVGAGGVGVKLDKVGANLRFKNINAASSKVTVANDSVNNEIDINIVENQINHNNLSNYLADQHINWTSSSTAIYVSSNSAAPYTFKANSTTNYGILSTGTTGSQNKMLTIENKRSGATREGIEFYLDPEFKTNRSGVDRYSYLKLGALHFETDSIKIYRDGSYLMFEDKSAGPYSLSDLYALTNDSIFVKAIVDTLASPPGSDLVFSVSGTNKGFKFVTEDCLPANGKLWIGETHSGVMLRYFEDDGDEGFRFADGSGAYFFSNAAFNNKLYLNTMGSSTYISYSGGNLTFTDSYNSAITLSQLLNDTTGAAVGNAIAADSAGRVLRNSYIKLLPGSIDSSIKINISSKLNGNVVATRDSLKKGTTKGVFTLYSDGNILVIDDAAFSGCYIGGQLVCAKNTCGSPITCFGTGISGDLVAQFWRADGSDCDLTDLVMVGELGIDLMYLTSE